MTIQAEINKFNLEINKKINNIVTKTKSDNAIRNKLFGLKNTYNKKISKMKIDSTLKKYFKDMVSQQVQRAINDYA